MAGMEKLSLGKKECGLIADPSPKAILFWPVSREEAVETVIEKIRSLTKTPFALLIVPISDWNRELSPWPAPAVFGKEDFPGGGETLLSWLRESAIPAMEARFGRLPLMIGGYSLAGLFALWAYYQGDFDGAASCSGSLWYPGWDDFADRHAPKENSFLYLSLGEREERTRNQIMAKVGDATRSQYFRAQKDPAIAEVKLQWHPGGHFNDPDGRTAAGFGWLLEKIGG